MAEGTLTRSRALKLMGAALLAGLGLLGITHPAEAKKKRKERKKVRTRTNTSVVLQGPPGGPGPSEPPGLPAPLRSHHLLCLCHHRRLPCLCHHLHRPADVSAAPARQLAVFVRR